MGKGFTRDQLTGFSGRSKKKRTTKGEVFGAGAGGFLERVGGDEDDGSGNGGAGGGGGGAGGGGGGAGGGGEGGANCGFGGGGAGGRGGGGGGGGQQEGEENRDVRKGDRELLRFGIGGSLTKVKNPKFRKPVKK